MKPDLSVFGNIPVTSAALGSLYPRLADKNQKLRQLEIDGDIIRLKKGLYVVRPRREARLLCTELIANYLYSPSYVSKSSALQFYGILPEDDLTMHSMTPTEFHAYDTPLGRFDYSYIKRDVYDVGVRDIVNVGNAIRIATPEKALCDLLAASSGVCLRYMNEVRDFVEGIGLRMDAFLRMDFKIFKQYIYYGGKKPNSVRNLMKYILYNR